MRRHSFYTLCGKQFDHEYVVQHIYDVYMILSWLLTRRMLLRTAKFTFSKQPRRQELSLTLANIKRHATHHLHLPIWQL